MTMSAEEPDNVVRIECLTCGWTHDVPQEDVVLDPSGMPFAKRFPVHRCTGEEDLVQRSSYMVNLHSEKPGYWIKITL